MAKIIVFPLTLQSPDERKRRRRPKQVDNIEVFPHSRRIGLVRELARAWRALPVDRRHDYLEAEILKACEALRRLGIDCELCEDDAIYGLAEGVGKQVHGPHFRLQL